MNEVYALLKKQSEILEELLRRELARQSPDFPDPAVVYSLSEYDVAQLQTRVSDLVSAIQRSRW